MKSFGVSNYFMGLFKKKDAKAFLPNGMEVTHVDILCIKDHLMNNNKVNAIKYVRTITGRDLKEAKAIVDEMSQSVKPFAAEFEEVPEKWTDEAVDDYRASFEDEVEAQLK